MAIYLIDYKLPLTGKEFSSLADVTNEAKVTPLRNGTFLTFLDHEIHVRGDKASVVIPSIPLRYSVDKKNPLFRFDTVSNDGEMLLRAVLLHH